MRFSLFFILIALTATSFGVRYYYALSEDLQQQTTTTKWTGGASRTDSGQSDLNRHFLLPDDGLDSQIETQQQIPAETDGVSSLGPMEADSPQEYQEVERVDQQIQRLEMADYLRANGYSEEDIEAMIERSFGPLPASQPPAPGEPISREQELANVREELMANADVYDLSTEDIEAMIERSFGPLPAAQPPAPSEPISPEQELANVREELMANADVYDLSTEDIEAMIQRSFGPLPAAQPPAPGEPISREQEIANVREELMADGLSMEDIEYMLRGLSMETSPEEI